MKKVLVIGSGGAGKSTFVRRLGAVTGIEVIHLDQLYWQPNWVRSANEDWQKVISKLLEKDAWLMDGNYSRTMEMRFAAADTIIFLDLPRIVCLYRILKRAAKYRNKNRPDMAEGCAERFDWEFVKWVWNYPQQTKPKIENLLERFADKTIVRLRSKTEAETFLLNYSRNSVIK